MIWLAYIAAVFTLVANNPQWSTNYCDSCAYAQPIGPVTPLEAPK